MMKSAMRIRGGSLAGSLHGRDDACRRRVDLRLQRSGGRRRDEPRANAFHGCREFTETLRLQGCRDFSSRPRELDRVVYDHGPPGAAH
jgi:hypothetical protein